MSRGPRILVSGATGFVGSRVARQLVAQGCDVVALVRPTASKERVEELGQTLRIVAGDVYRPASWDTQLAELRPAGLVHLAWHAEPGNYLTHLGNLTDLTASIGLLERAHAWGCARFVCVGTCLEYDTRLGYLSEDARLAPRSLYASCKAALYLAASAWARRVGVSLAWARLFYQFGPGEDPRRLVPSVVIALLTGRRIGLTSGLQVRDYLHVDDVATALSRLVLTRGAGPFNIGSARPVRVRDLVQMVENEIGRPGLIQFGALPDPEDDPPFICADNTRLRTTTDWQPTRTLEEGLKDTIAWWTERTRNINTEALR